MQSYPTIAKGMEITSANTTVLDQDVDVFIFKNLWLE